LLHLGSTAQAVRARPLGSEHARLHLASPLPLRVGDRGLLRDPGSRRVWGVRVADPLPAPLDRRGAAVARAKDLAGLSPTLAGHVALRRLTRRSLLDRLGVGGPPAPGTLEVGDWLVSPEHAAALLERLHELVDRSSDEGVPLTAAARSLDLDDPAVVAALSRAPLVVDHGSVRKAGTTPAPLPEPLREGLEKVQAMLADAPFAAPDAARLRELALDDPALALLHRRGDLLRVADGVVLLPGADDLAVHRLADLPQPFRVSAAREALGTSRRVVLPLLAHLDRTGRTVRLADDTRRVRGPA
jgi:selenocysteine-specific elongation factor